MNNNFQAALQQLRSNPVQFLLQRRLNIPQNINLNDPNAIAQHLLNTGQVTQAQYNEAMQAAKRMMQR